jgi:hypothetical protein
MTIKRYDIGGFYNKLRDSQIDSTRSINSYQSMDPITQKKTIIPASGHKFAKDITASDAHRAGFVREDKGFSYIVVGNEVIELNTILAETVLGTIGTTSGYVGVSSNEKEVVFVDGTAGWRWDIAGATFSQIFFGGPPFPQPGPGIGILPVDITNLNNFLIVVDPTTNKWHVSQPNSAKDWATLDSVVFTGAGSILVGCRALHERLFIFGNLTTQVWSNPVVLVNPPGVVPFPFIKDTSILIEHGLAARGSLKEAFELMFYISNDSSGVSGIQMIEGTLPQKISTPAMDLALQELTTIEDAQALLYKENGLIFYQLSFSTDNKTFVYVFPDTTPRQMGSWHELQTTAGDRHIASTHFYFTRKHYIGSYLDQRLYELSYLFSTYDGELIKNVLFGPLIETEGHKRIRIDRFEVVMVTGLIDPPVPVTDPSQQPQLFLSLSRDGGKTYGNIRKVSVGNTSDFQKRVIFRRLGVLRGRNIIPKIEFYSKIPLYITGIVLTYQDLPQ